MSFVMPEIVVRKIIDYGIKQLRKNKPAFDNIFCTFVEDELKADYGEAYRDKIWEWFSTAKIPVIQAWSFNVQKIPCVSVHLANETEDESKASIGDYMGNFNETSETQTGVFTVMVDIGIHANKGGDHVLWLYYIVNYILFKHKLMAHRLGLKLHTFSASDYSKDSLKMADNIWTRWIRFRCTTENTWEGDNYVDIEDINTDEAIGLEPASDVSFGLDVDPETVDDTYNAGLKAGRATDEAGDDDLNI